MHSTVKPGLKCNETAPEGRFNSSEELGKEDAVVFFTGTNNSLKMTQKRFLKRRQIELRNNKQ